MPKTKTRPWDPAEHLADAEDMAAYLEAALEDGDPRVVAAALGDIARDTGVSTSTVFAVFSLALLVSGPLGPWAGRHIDRLGGRALLMGTNAVFALGLVHEVEEIGAVLRKNGKEALEILDASRGEYAAVLLDLCMPVLDGWQTLAAVRRAEQRDSLPRMPIFCCTSECLEERAAPGSSACARARRKGAMRR